MTNETATENWSTYRDLKNIPETDESMSIFRELAVVLESIAAKAPVLEDVVGSAILASAKMAEEVYVRNKAMQENLAIFKQKKDTKKAVTQTLKTALEADPESWPKEMAEEEEAFNNAINVRAKLLAHVDKCNRVSYMLVPLLATLREIEQTSEQNITEALVNKATVQATEIAAVNQEELKGEAFRLEATERTIDFGHKGEKLFKRLIKEGSKLRKKKIEEIKRTLQSQSYGDYKIIGHEGNKNITPSTNNAHGVEYTVMLKRAKAPQHLTVKVSGLFHTKYSFVINTPEGNIEIHDLKSKEELLEAIQNALDPKKLSTAA